MFPLKMFTDLGPLRRFSDLRPKYVKKKPQKENEFTISHRTFLLQKKLQHFHRAKNRFRSNSVVALVVDHTPKVPSSSNR